MLHNDLSNVNPPRLIVTLDLISTLQPKVERRFLGTKVTHELLWDPKILSYLFQWSFVRGVTLELAVVDRDEDPAELEESLDRWGTNPFTWVQDYESVQHLVDGLPYRRDVYGVCDVPERGARYGSYYVELETLP